MASDDEEQESQAPADQGAKGGGALDDSSGGARGGGAIPVKPEDRSAPEGSAMDHLTVGQGNEMAAVLAGDERAFQQIQEGKETLRVTGEVLDAGVRTVFPAVEGAEGFREGNALKVIGAAVSVLPGDEAIRGAVQAGKLAKLADDAVRFHHPLPQYLGGQYQQILEPLPKGLHDSFHSGLDKVLPRKWGTEYYERLKPAARQQAMQDLADYTRAFDSVHGTQLYDAMVREGFGP